MKKISRRNALKKSLAGAAAISAPMILPSSVLGLNGKNTSPNSRVNVGLIGNGKIQKGHRAYHSVANDVQVVALSDVKTWMLKEANADVKKLQGEEVDTYEFYEDLLARDDIDAVVIGTPDHWHAKIAIDAFKAGKDVYVEKPMTLTIEEGKIMRETCARYGRVLQVGSQQRSEWAFRKAAELVRNGYIGKVKTIAARLGNFPPPTQFPATPIPEGLNYDRWLGPAPMEPYNELRIKGDYRGGWRRFWDYGSRKNGDWGAHHYDIIQWALGMDESGPTHFVPKGYKGEEYQYFTYADGTKVIRGYEGLGHMIRFIGEEGEVRVSRGGKIDTTPAALKNAVLKTTDQRLYVSNDHRRDWLNGIRSRQQTLCHVGIGHRTATICHLSGISERLGRPIDWDPKTEHIVGDARAAMWESRPRRALYDQLV
jgi:predicted dehydrogenase